MDFGLTGKVAWVLGASSGLGRASADSLAREGADVALSARRESLLKEIASEIEGGGGGRSLPVALDVTDRDAIHDVAARVASELGPIDILVANAGGPPPGIFSDIGDDTLHDAFTLTTESAWQLAKAVVPQMRERKQGCIVFLTSGSTKEVVPGLLLSNMMRAAVVGMAKTMSKELGPDGIRVVCVAPGRIETARVQSLDETTAQSSGRSIEEVRAANRERIPLGRYGRPEEFGDVVAFVASPRASYVSGTTVLVDGGALNGILS